MDIENQMITGKYDTFQFNKFAKCNTYICNSCDVVFNSCENGVEFDSESYCDVDCLINYLMTDGIITEIE